MTRTLDDWLAGQLAAHPSEIELGLDRVGRVADRLNLRDPAPQRVVVGGTNGKGSTVALVRGLIGTRARVGCYTSPHLWRYNERIVVDGRPASDARIVSAFEAIEAVREDIALTFFEWGTLAALWIFRAEALDLALLEVGLGGRLDAVNIVDSDVALVTSVGLDHTEWLGDTRDAIGGEKAGIYRPGHAALCADRDPPAGLVERAQAVGARLRCIGTDFDLTEDITPGVWHYVDAQGRDIRTAARPGVLAENLAGAIATVLALGYTVDEQDIDRAALAQRDLKGRRETIDGPIPILYDVGHNEQAVARLCDDLAARPVDNDTHLVIGMLKDKPVEAVGARLAPYVDHWYPAGLDDINPRGLSAAGLAERLGLASLIHDHDSPAAALARARSVAKAGDRIVVCGSFFTVAQARSPET